MRRALHARLASAASAAVTPPNKAAMATAMTVRRRSGINVGQTFGILFSELAKLRDASVEKTPAARNDLGSKLLARSSTANGAMDALSEVLRLVRLTGAVFLNAELSAPGRTVAALDRAGAGIDARSRSHDRVPPGDRRPMLYQGRGRGLKLEQGDLVMVPRGDTHRMSSELQPLTVPVSTDPR